MLTGRERAGHAKRIFEWWNPWCSSRCLKYMKRTKFKEYVLNYQSSRWKELAMLVRLLFCSIGKRWGILLSYSSILKLFEHSFSHTFPPKCVCISCYASLLNLCGIVLPLENHRFVSIKRWQIEGKSCRCEGLLYIINNFFPWLMAAHCPL